MAPWLATGEVAVVVAVADNGMNCTVKRIDADCHTWAAAAVEGDTADGGTKTLTSAALTIL